MDIDISDFFQEENDEVAAESAAELLAHAIAMAEGKEKDVPAAAYRRAHARLFRNAVARENAPSPLRRLSTPTLMWGYLRSVATGSVRGSCAEKLRTVSSIQFLMP